MKKIYYLLFAISFSINYSLAQNSTKITISNKKTQIIKVGKINSTTDYLFYQESGSDFIKLATINYQTDNLQILDSIHEDELLNNNNYIKKNYFSDSSGVYFWGKTTSNNTLHYTLHYANETGNILVKNDASTYPDGANSSYDPEILFEKDNKVYFKRFVSPDQHELVTFDKSTDQIQTVQLFTTKIVQSYIYQDSLYTVIKQNDSLQFYNSLNLLNTVPRFSIYYPENSSYNELIGVRNQEIFIRKIIGPSSNSSNQLYAVWKTNFTQSGTSLFLDSVTFSSITFDNDDFIAVTNNNFWKGNYNSPQLLTQLPLPSQAKFTGDRIDFQYTKDLFRFSSFQTGEELAHIENDSIKLYADFSPGSKSGAPSKIRPGSYNPYPFYKTATDRIFMVLTNGNDDSLYLYSLYNGNFTSYFPIYLPEELLKIHTSDDYAYFLRNSSAELYIQKRSLINNLFPQPSVPDSALTWYRYIRYPYFSQSFWSGQSVNSDYTSNCVLTEDGSLVGGFKFSSLYDMLLIGSDGYCSDSVKGANVIFKYDPYGTILWTKNFGDDYTIGLNKPVFTVDKAGDILVFGDFSDSAMFDNEMNYTYDKGYFLLKLNGSTGETVWRKILTANSVNNTLNIEAIQTDEQNNIFLSFLYSNYHLTIQNLYTSSTVSPANAIAKFDKNGTIIWLKTIKKTLPNQSGFKRIFSYDEEKDQFFSCQSRGYFYYASTCEFENWNYFIQQIDGNGTSTAAFQLTSSDLGSVTCGDISGDSLIGYGYVRGTLKAGIFENTTPVSGSCNNNSGFQFIYSSEKNDILALNVTTEPFYPIRNRTYGNYNYVLGTDDNKNLLIIRFTTTGKEAGYIYLNQKANVFNDEYSIYFDATDDYIALIGDEFKADTTYRVTEPAIDDFPFKYKSILKFSNENWQNDKTWFQPVQPKYFEQTDQEFIIFPNPFTNQITLTTRSIDESFDSYELYDLNGKMITTGNLEKVLHQEINLPNLNAGIYFIKLNSAGMEKVTKLIKL